MALEPGQVIDSKYRVIRLIGEGGMGTVYEGENTRIARRVAIKVLHAQVAAMADFVARFEREARAVARIGSQHVCDVLDLGDLPNGDRYIVMEYLDGVSFEDRLVEQGKLTPAQLAPIAFELLEGLGTMHVAGVIHRDLKPANVFLSRTSGGRGEMVKILDFGVAKLQPLAGEVGSMTQTGTMMGTPLYMSPEQARGARDVAGRTDIYAASVMFYRALTGVLPYNAETLNELLFKIVLEDPKPLRELAPEVDEVFAALVHKGLARELPQRFQSARAFQDEIGAWAKTQGRSSLSFAVTHPSEIPPRTPITLPEPIAQSAGGLGSPPPGSARDGGRPAASAAAAPGTPIAWSEAAPGHASSANLVGATVLTPISSHKPSPVGSVGAAGSAAPSTSTLTSSGSLATSGASKDDGAAAVAQATTAPGSVAVPDVSAAAGEKKSSSAPAKSSRGLIFGIVGAGAMAVVGLAAFGRGGGEKAGAGATTAPASAGLSAGATVVESSSSTTATSPPAAVDSAAASATSAAAANGSAAPTSARKDGTPPPQRKLEPATTKTSGTPTTGTASGGATISAGASSAQAATSAAAAAASSATAKPAGSARKFRTNLD
jgi:serine/threonine-protein kinase